MLHIEPVKAFRDNYLWVFNVIGTNAACVVDPGDAEPVLNYLRTNNLELTAILVTHHHADHIGGINTLLAHKSVPVFGPNSDKIPQVTHKIKEGDAVTILGITFNVLEVPGHTLDHVAYFTNHFATTLGPVLFCGDTLFAAGCGRMFEGTPPIMYKSLQKIAGLSPNTQVFCTHEYTLSNLNFAAAVMPDNPEVQQRIKRETAKREQDMPTIPSTIALELSTNPFLRCTDATVVASANNQPNAQTTNAAAVFGTLRRWKDNF